MYRQFCAVCPGHLKAISSQGDHQLLQVAPTFSFEELTDWHDSTRLVKFFSQPPSRMKIIRQLLQLQLDQVGR